MGQIFRKIKLGVLPVFFSILIGFNIVLVKSGSSSSGTIEQLGNMSKMSQKQFVGSFDTDISFTEAEKRIINKYRNLENGYELVSIDEELAMFGSMGNEDVGTGFLIQQLVEKVTGIKSTIRSSEATMNQTVDYLNKTDRPSITYGIIGDSGLNNYPNVKLGQKMIFQRSLYAYFIKQDINNEFNSYINIEDLMLGNGREYELVFAGNTFYEKNIRSMLNTSVSSICFDSLLFLEEFLEATQHRVLQTTETTCNVSNIMSADKDIILISGVQSLQRFTKIAERFDYQAINGFMPIQLGKVIGSNSAADLVSVIEKILTHKNNKEIINQYTQKVNEDFNKENMQYIHKDRIRTIRNSVDVLKLSTVKTNDYNQAAYSAYVYEIARRISEMYELPYELKEYKTYEEALKGLEKGDVDIVPDIALNSEMDDSMYLSMPYEKSEYVLISKISENVIFEISELYKYKMGVSKVGYVTESVHNILEPYENVSKVYNYKTDLIPALKKDEVDFIISTERYFTSYRDVERNYSLKIGYRLKTHQELAFGFRKSNTATNGYRLTDEESKLLRNLTTEAMRKLNIPYIRNHYSPSEINVGELLVRNQSLITFLSILSGTTFILGVLVFVVLILSHKKKTLALTNEVRFDFLTKLKTRKALYENYKAHKAGTFLSIDLDEFKHINDTYGHDVGDDVLVFVSSKMLEFFGKDNCYRMGGDEFVIMSEAKSEIANLDKMILEIAKGIKTESGVHIDVKMSVGYSEEILEYEKETGKIDIKDTLKILDNAMYTAKKSKSDSVIVVGKEQIEEYFKDGNK